MKRYEYKVLSFDTSGDEPNSRELATLDMEIEIDSYGSEGYELRNTNVIGHTIYVFLMREKP